MTGDNYKVSKHRWGTITTIRGPRFALGVHVGFKPFYVDLHLIWWIVGFGSVVYELEPVE